MTDEQSQQPAPEQGLPPQQPAQEPQAEPQAPQVDRIVIPEDVAEEAVITENELRYRVLSDLRHRMDLSPKGFEALEKALKVDQTAKGLIPSVELSGIPEAERAGLAGLPLVHDNESGVSQYDVDLVRQALMNYVGDEAFRAIATQPDSFSPMGEAQPTAPGVQDLGDGTQLREGADGFLLEEANAKPILLRKGSSHALFKKAQEMAAKTGQKIQWIDDAPNPAAVYRNGDIKLPPGHTHRDYAEASHSADVTGRAICDANGNVIRPREDRKFATWESEQLKKWGYR